MLAASGSGGPLRFSPADFKNPLEKGGACSSMGAGIPPGVWLGSLLPATLLCPSLLPPTAPRGPPEALDAAAGPLLLRGPAGPCGRNGSRFLRWGWSPPSGCPAESQTVPVTVSGLEDSLPGTSPNLVPANTCSPGEHNTAVLFQASSL